MTIRSITLEDIHMNMLDQFERKQIVKERYVSINGELCIESIDFIDDWDLEERRKLVQTCFIDVLKQSGYIAGIFKDHEMRAFVILSGESMGPDQCYMELKMLHVSRPYRSNGWGKALFDHACKIAKQKGAQKLYISAHSACETQAFYKSVGCVPALWISPVAVAMEPCDIQLEKKL